MLNFVFVKRPEFSMKYLNFLKSFIDKEARLLCIWNWVFEHLIFLVQIVIIFEKENQIKKE